MGKIIVSKTVFRGSTPRSLEKKRMLKKLFCHLRCGTPPQPKSLAPQKFASPSAEGCELHFKKAGLGCVCANENYFLSGKAEKICLLFVTRSS